MKILLQGVKGKVKLEGSWKMDQEECNQKCNEAREMALFKRDIEDSIYFFFFFGYYQKLYIPKYSINTSDKPQKVHFKAKVYHILTFILIIQLFSVNFYRSSNLVFVLPMKYQKTHPQ